MGFAMLWFVHDQLLYLWLLCRLGSVYVCHDINQLLHVSLTMFAQHFGFFQSIMSWHQSINQHSLHSFHVVACLVKDTLKLLPAMAPRRLVVAALGKNFDYRHPRSFRAVKHVDWDCFSYAPGKFPFMCLAILDFRWTAGKAAWVPRWLQVTDQSCWVEEPLLGVKAAKVEMSKALKLPA